MKIKKDCKIVQDLLPNYIEKLTNEETNQFIEAHLKECEECRKILENMQKNLEVTSCKREKKEVNYLKKFSYQMTILKSILGIILLVFIGITGRKMWILRDLSNRAEETAKSTNYHVTSYYVVRDAYFKDEIFYTENKRKHITCVFTEEEGMTKYTSIIERGQDELGKNEHSVKEYREDKNGKNVVYSKVLGEFDTNSLKMQSTFSEDNLWQLLIRAISASIKTTTYNGKECYYISHFKSFYHLPDDTFYDGIQEGIYVDKETGLIISTAAYEYDYRDLMKKDGIQDDGSYTGLVGRNDAQEYVYEFDTVTEADLAEPDDSEYKVAEHWQDLIYSSEYVTILELLQLTEVNYTTIKEYRDNGLLPYEQREGELNLYPTEETLERLDKIENLKEQGLSLEEIKVKLESE